jgi:hypothetical protein
MTTDSELIALAGKLTKAQRRCGDVLDDLPCTYCGARSLRGCTLDTSAKGEVAELINSTPGLMNLLHKDVRKVRATMGGAA